MYLLSMHTYTRVKTHTNTHTHIYYLAKANLEKQKKLLMPENRDFWWE